MRKISLFLIGIFAVSITTMVQPAHADLQSATYRGIFSQNNLTGWNPEECEYTSSSGGGGSISGGNLSVCSTSLPSETVSKIEGDGIKDAIAQNMERYKYAEEKTGLPWQILATLHWREDGAGSNTSISNGEELYDHVNVDGVHISADPKEDAVQAAHNFIDIAKEVYGIDVLSDKSQDAYGYGFLAYNRGYMYKCNGNVSYTESPYVMNFYDSAHQNMAWSSADSMDCNGNTLNDVAGSTNSQVGALAIMAYLCGGTSSSSSAAPSSSSTSGATDSSSSSSDSASSPESSSPSESDSSTSSSGNCTTYEGEYPQYFQQTDHTCGQTSMAMLATVAAGKDITESDVISATGGDSQAYASTIGSGMVALDKKVGDKYGFTVEQVDVDGLSDAATKMKEYLNNGYMIHMSGEGCMISPTCETHYTGMFKLNGNKVLLADSSSLSNREVDLDEYVLSGYHGDSFSAIKGSGGSGTCIISGSVTPACGDGSSGSSGSGSGESYNGTGLTDEQADKLAANYNNNTDNWASKAGAGLFCEGGDCASAYSNCSLMSAFFVEMFTSVGTGQAWSGMYGGNVVNVLSGMGFSTGSEPKAFSVFSCGPTDWGHTGVVVRVDGDSITTVEAGYPNMVGQRSNMSICSGMGYGTATYAYLNDKMDTQKLMNFIGK